MQPQNAKRIYLSSPTMHGEELAFVQEAFDTNWIAPLGKNVDEFEREVCAHLGTGHAAALCSGTAALHLALKLCGVGRGDVVLCPDLTFAATVNPVSYEGGRQVFIDAERDSWNMDPRALKIALSRYWRMVRAVLVVNLYGTPARLDEIARLCAEYGVPLIEDAAESMGALHNGRQTGGFGRYGVLSFNGNKIITTSGGGMLLSHDKQAIEHARYWATQARDPAPHYQHSDIGYNYRMSNVLAGIGRGQLLHLHEHIRAKADIYARYRDALSGLPVSMNPYLPESRPNFWLSCLLLSPGARCTPEDIRQALERENIEARPLWKPMHLQPVFAGYDFISVDGDVGADLFARGLCLPSDIKMTCAEQDRVIEIVKSCLA